MTTATENTADATPATEQVEGAAAAAEAADTGAQEETILGNAKPGGEGGAAADAGADAGDGADAGAGADKVDPAAPDETPFEGLTPPEGFAALDNDALSAATPIMRKFGVDSPEKAQAFVNEFAPVLQGMMERGATAAQEAQTQAQNDLRASWAAEVRADKEIGGANYERTVQHAGLFMDKFMTQDDREFLTATGLGNNPGLVRAFAKAGELLSEGTIHRGGAVDTAKPQTMEGALYGDMKPVA